jgi:D-alanyl-D-alanine carboxypeptidase
MRLMGLFTAIVLALVGFAEPPSEPRVHPADALQSALDRWAALPAHRGVSAAVVFADGMVWAGAAGTAADDEPLRTDHLIQIGSITKTMTAAVVLQLVDERVLRLEDPISRWLPRRAFVNPAITLRQLLNHTNGLANYTGTTGLSRAIAERPSHALLPTELLSFIGPARFPPGRDTEYTNTAFIVLGMVAEEATGRSMVENYHQRLWLPLELDRIFLPALEPHLAPVASALTSSDRILAPLDYPAVLSIGHSAFGLLADATTVARWGRALFIGKVISEDRQREMRALVPAAGNIPGETGSGLGIRSYEYLGRTQYGHSGSATFGNSLLLFDPESGVTVAVLMNQGAGAGHFQLAPELLALASRP